MNPCDLGATARATELTQDESPVELLEVNVISLTSGGGLMSMAWADSIVDTLYAHERVGQHGGRDAYDLATFVVLTANALLFAYTAYLARKSAQTSERAAEAADRAAQATLRSAQEARASTQIQLVHSLLGQLFSESMTEAVGLIMGQHDNPKPLSAAEERALDRARTKFLSYGWHVGSLLEEKLLDEAAARVAMPVGWAEDYQTLFRTDPLAELFLKLHGLPIPPIPPPPAP